MPFVLGFICLPMIALSDVLQGMSRAHSWAFFGAVADLPGAAGPDPGVHGRGACSLGYRARRRDRIDRGGRSPPTSRRIWQLVGVTGARRRASCRPARARSICALWFVVSLPIFLVESFFFLLTNADVLMVGALHGARTTSRSISPRSRRWRWCISSISRSRRASRSAMPQFTHGDPDKLADFARETVAWTFWPSLFDGDRGAGCSASRC